MVLVLYEAAVMRYYSQDSAGNDGAQDASTPSVLTLDDGDIQTFAPNKDHSISEVWIAANTIDIPAATIAKTRLVLRTVPTGDLWQDPSTPSTKVLSDAVWPYLAVSGYGVDTGETPDIATPDAYFTANYTWVRFAFSTPVAVNKDTVYALNFLVEGLEDLHLVGTSNLPDFYGALVDDEDGAYSGYYKYRYAYSTIPVSLVATPPDNNYAQVYGANWVAQSFTPGSSYPSRIVSLRWSRTGLPGNVTVSLKATDVDGKPTGADLASATVDGDDLESTPPTGPGSMKWVRLDTIVSLVSGTVYAIVVRAPSGDANNRVDWRGSDTNMVDPPSATLRTSADSGATWSAHLGYDVYFESFNTPNYWQSYGPGGLAFRIYGDVTVPRSLAPGIKPPPVRELVPARTLSFV